MGTQIVELRKPIDWKPQRTSSGLKRRKNLNMAELVHMIRFETFPGDVNHGDSSRSREARERTRERQKGRAAKRELRSVFA